MSAAGQKGTLQPFHPMFAPESRHSLAGIACPQGANRRRWRKLLGHCALHFERDSRPAKRRQRYQIQQPGKIVLRCGTASRGSRRWAKSRHWLSFTQLFRRTGKQRRLRLTIKVAEIRKNGGLSRKSGSGFIQLQLAQSLVKGF
jgi:hypothetical protein